MLMKLDKRRFFVKAVLVGLLGVSTSIYHYDNLGDASIHVPLWITSMVFADHFRVVLLFWLAFEKWITEKYWILAGLIGSLLYATSFWLLQGFVFLEAGQLTRIIVQFSIGALSAIPIWFVLKANYAKAYLWIGVYGIGYAFLELFNVISHFVTNVEFVKTILYHSFFTLQVVPKGLWAFAYIAFGLLLGLCFYRIVIWNRAAIAHQEV